jgi:LemA protein
MFAAYPWGRWIKRGVIILVVIIVLISLVSNYNGLTIAEQSVNSKWSQVNNVMQSRADKINNLVEVVKGYVKHEEKVFGDVAAARSTLMSGGADINSKLAADTQLAKAARGMLLLVENYPDLKADQQFTNLQVAIEGAENRVSVERMRFIEAVEKYNIKVTRFPSNLFAKILGYGPKNYFEANTEGQQVPKVKF